MIINLFTQPLYSAKFKKHDEYKSKLEPLLYQDIKEADSKNTHDEWWHCNSYQTYLRGYGQEDLESEMFTYIDEYMSELGYSGFTYSINSSWFNMYGPNQYQEEHAHDPNMFSGLYTLRFDKELHKGINFTNKYPEMSALHKLWKLEPRNFNYAYGTVNMPLEEGNIYIFPASLRHKVPPQPATLEKDNYRITFTFNVAPEGY